MVAPVAYRELYLCHVEDLQTNGADSLVGHLGDNNLEEGQTQVFSPFNHRIPLVEGENQDSLDSL